MMESVIEFLCNIIGWIMPFECMELSFMRQAMLALLLLAPMTAVCGTQVVNSQSAFFSDAIGHSAFAGVAFGLLLSLSPSLTMPLLAVIVGTGIMMVRRKSGLSTDTIIGVFFSAVVAAGLAVVSRFPENAKSMQMFLYGDVLTISETDLASIGILFIVFMIFEFFSFNPLICMGLNIQLAKAHRIRAALHGYLFAVMLSLVVIFSVKAVGVLLVTAMLITPAAAARNLTQSFGKMVWLAFAIGLVSAVSGLLLSAQDFMRTAAGATIVLIACVFFILSLIFRRHSRK